MAMIFGMDLWDEMDALQRQMDRLADDRRSTRKAPQQQQQQQQEVEWVPLTDLFESEAAFHIVMELPGVRKEDVTVDLRDSVLSITGVKAEPEGPAAAATSRRAFRVERPLGRFARSFNVPVTVDPAAIAATFVDGVLRINIAKPKQPEPRKITVQ